jgi:hypothetical protein
MDKLNRKYHSTIDINRRNHNTVVYDILNKKTEPSVSRPASNTMYIIIKIPLAQLINNIDISVKPIHPLKVVQDA